MSRYRIWESVLDRSEEVHSYEEMEIHHPRRNQRGLKTGKTEDFEPKRQHQRVDGEFEEVRQLGDGRVLVKKDFVLQQDVPGPVRIPAPAEGYVHYLGDATAAMRIYDRPFGTPGARLLAQSLHMDPSSFELKEGSRIAYGQPMGIMSDTGTPGAVHAHIEAEPEQFRRYIRDIDSGVIVPGGTSLEARGRQATENRSGTPLHHARNQTAVLRQGDQNPRVRELQQTLATLGYRNPDGTPLGVDGDFGANTRAAVEAFQREHGLKVDGVVGNATQRVLAATQANPFEDKSHPQHALYTQALRGVHAEEARRQVPHGRHSENLAGALTAAAANAGLARIDRVELNVDGSRARAVQVHPLRDEPGLNRVTMAIETHVVVQAPKQAHAHQDSAARDRHAVQAAQQQVAAPQPAPQQAASSHADEALAAPAPRHHARAVR